MRFRKIISMFLLALIGFSTFSVGELLKVPLLVEHYGVHKGLDSEINFQSFLFYHYALENGSDKDADTDRQLPFNSAEAYMSAPVPVTVSLGDMAVPRALRFPIHQVYLLANDRLISESFQSDVWQPPRL